MELLLIIIIIILAYFLFKSKKKKGEDFVETANKYGKAFKDATNTFRESVKEKDSSDTLKEKDPSDTLEDTSSLDSEVDELKKFKKESFTKVGEISSKLLLSIIGQSLVLNKISFEKFPSLFLAPKYPVPICHTKSPPFLW